MHTIGFRGCLTTDRSVSRFLREMGFIHYSKKEDGGYEDTA